MPPPPQPQPGRSPVGRSAPILEVNWICTLAGPGWTGRRTDPVLQRASAPGPRPPWRQRLAALVEAVREAERAPTNSTIAMRVVDAADGYCAAVKAAGQERARQLGSSCPAPSPVPPFMRFIVSTVACSPDADAVIGTLEHVTEGRKRARPGGVAAPAPRVSGQDTYKKELQAVNKVRWLCEAGGYRRSLATGAGIGRARGRSHWFVRRGHSPPPFPPQVILQASNKLLHTAGHYAHWELGDQLAQEGSSPASLGGGAAWLQLAPFLDPTARIDRTVNAVYRIASQSVKTHTSGGNRSRSLSCSTCRRRRSATKSGRPCSWRLRGTHCRRVTTMHSSEPGKPWAGVGAEPSRHPRPRGHGVAVRA